MPFGNGIAGSEERWWASPSALLIRINSGVADGTKPISSCVTGLTRALTTLSCSVAPTRVGVPVAGFTVNKSADEAGYPLVEYITEACDGTMWKPLPKSVTDELG